MEIVNTDTVWQAIMGYWFIFGALGFLLIPKETRRKHFYKAMFFGGPMCWVALCIIFVANKLNIRLF